MLRSRYISLGVDGTACSLSISRFQRSLDMIYRDLDHKLVSKYALNFLFLFFFFIFSLSRRLIRLLLFFLDFSGQFFFLPLHVLRRKSWSVFHLTRISIIRYQIMRGTSTCIRVQNLKYFLNFSEIFHVPKLRRKMATKFSSCNWPKIKLTFDEYCIKSRNFPIT